MIDRVNRRLAPATRVAFPVLLFAPPETCCAPVPNACPR